MKWDLSHIVDCNVIQFIWIVGPPNNTACPGGAYRFVFIDIEVCWLMWSGGIEPTEIVLRFLFFVVNHKLCDFFSLFFSSCVWVRVVFVHFVYHWVAGVFIQGMLFTCIKEMSDTKLDLWNFKSLFTGWTLPIHPMWIEINVICNTKGTRVLRICILHEIQVVSIEFSLQVGDGVFYWKTIDAT